MARHPQASKNETKNVTFHTYNRHFYIHYPEKTCCTITHPFLVIYHFMYTYFIPYSVLGGGTYLFPSLPHFLIIPDFEEKQYLELTHSLQIDDKLV